MGTDIIKGVPNHEDIGIIERMQSSRSSEGFDGGVLSPHWDLVQQHYASLIAESVASPRIPELDCNRGSRAALSFYYSVIGELISAALKPQGKTGHSAIQLRAFTIVNFTYVITFLK